MPKNLPALKVSRLPASCSFFLAALQPLGFRFTGHQTDHIGFGTSKASEFLVYQGSERVEPTCITFQTPSRLAVNEFFAAAVKAGGEPHNGATQLGQSDGTYRVAVLDLDDNVIEVVHCGNSDTMSAVSTSRGSGVTEYHPTGAGSCTGVTRRTPLHTIVNNIVTTTATSTSMSQDDPTGSSKALMGTLLGAAAGATVAYAMMQAENPAAPHSSPPGGVHRTSVTYRSIDASQTSPSTNSRRRTSFDSSQASRSSRTVRPMQTGAIEAPPSSYADDVYLRSPSHVQQALPPPPSVHTVSTFHGTPRPEVGLELARSRAPRTTRTSRRPSNATPSVQSIRTVTRTASAADVPLPPSTRVSIQRSLTTGPADADRSVAGRSTASVSTVRPLTQAALERASAAGLADPLSPPNAAAGLGDLETVVPDDSISQASSKHHRKKHPRHPSDDGASGRHGATRRETAGSAVTMPAREVKREREPRTVVTALGFRGRSG